MNASEDNILHLLDSATVAMILEDIEETETPENIMSTDLLICSHGQAMSSFRQRFNSTAVH